MLPRIQTSKCLLSLPPRSTPSPLCPLMEKKKSAYTQSLSIIPSKARPPLIFSKFSDGSTCSLEGWLHDAPFLHMASLNICSARREFTVHSYGEDGFRSDVSEFGMKKVSFLTLGRCRGDAAVGVFTRLYLSMSPFWLRQVDTQKDSLSPRVAPCTPAAERRGNMADWSIVGGNGGGESNSG